MLMFIKPKQQPALSVQDQWSFEELRIWSNGAFTPPEIGEKYPPSEIYAMFDDCDAGRVVGLDHILLEIKSVENVPKRRCKAFNDAVGAAESILENSDPTHDYREPPPEPL